MCEVLDVPCNHIDNMTAANGQEFPAYDCGSVLLTITGITVAQEKFTSSVLLHCSNSTSKPILGLLGMEAMGTWAIAKDKIYMLYPKNANIETTICDREVHVERLKKMKATLSVKAKESKTKDIQLENMAKQIDRMTEEFEKSKKVKDTQLENMARQSDHMTEEFEKFKQGNYATKKGTSDANLNVNTDGATEKKDELQSNHALIYHDSFVRVLSDLIA
eukprot:TRINITY_DN5279_c0_g1_i1.p2 TRINITY_DN5279_c0_g1~~TRINITY_DN5279_c0_g1_i1.p2  ORF type:complete len:219 (+),score=16.87 TRINITY_DN5279_c0_g1_i1:1079-1735(+)